MKKYDEIYEIVKNTLSEKRMYHSKCVSERAVEYAKIYGADIEKARMAGILHDIAKEIPKEERIPMCIKYGIELDETELMCTELIHGKLGAEIAKKEFGLDDEICSAIKYHTTGKENMNLLEKILYLADFTGIDRKYEKSTELYEISKSNLDDAIYEMLKYNINHITSQNKILHLNSVKAYNFFLKENEKNFEK